MASFVYFFGAGQAEGGNDLRHLVGGKGASLAEMTRARLNVPPGFTISSECCRLFYDANQVWPVGLEEQVRAGLRRLEGLVGRTFGKGDNPLLVAVRSGAAQSMPGMMDTVLNVGLTPECVRAVAGRTGRPRDAWDAYRHFLVGFGHTVAGIPEEIFANAGADYLRELHRQHEGDLDGGQMEQLCSRLEAVYQSPTRQQGPPLAGASGSMADDPWQMLVDAINAVFRSWNSERAIIYRQHHQIEGLLGTAVNVQMMCPSEVSGVMFTANPVNPALAQILVEASYGLGEAIVLGKVTPDRFVLDKHSLDIVEREIAVKERQIAGLAEAGAVSVRPKDAASLTDAQVVELARLGLRVEDYFQHPCDIEWGLAQGDFYLLQSRAIKSWKGPAPSPPMAYVDGLADLQPLTAVELEQAREAEIAALRTRAEPLGTVWSRYNLAEVLPEPTPMTWAIVRRFMSGKGGFGQMYRDLGFDPDPALDEDGIFDLVCGRPYCNLSREPRMQYRTLPFEHPFAALKNNPQRALYPRSVLNPARASWRFWLFLPAVFFKLLRSGLRLRRESLAFARRFREDIIPAFVAECDKETATDIGALDNAALLERLDYWRRRTLFDFARDSLKPTALAAVALGNLERALARSFGQGVAGMQRAEQALRELVMGVHPEPDTDLPGAIRALAAGELDRATFLKRFGHRGNQEMELSQPRWAEDPALLDRLTASSVSPLTTHNSPLDQDTWQRIATDAKLTPSQQATLEAELKTAHIYLGLRETAKHYLMKGYALIRRILVELDRRYELVGGIFFLTPEELPQLIQQAAPPVSAQWTTRIAERKRHRELVLSLHVPQVIFSDDLEAIGRPEEAAASGALQGVPLSAGVAEGFALVLNYPDVAAVPDEPYILVCPSTDPAWVPLFVKARALVMETGGVLSHGAIVAREFGLPAVAGLPDVHHRLHTGQRLRVDGGSGRVIVLA